MPVPGTFFIPMNYKQSVGYLNSLINYERWISVNPKRSFNLNRMRAFSKRLGNPHDKFRSVHVAGTKGKGSTVAILASILQASGYRVGRYTSPHLVNLRERIAIDGKWISEKDFAAEMSKIKKSLGNLKPTYFEAMTLLAFLTFAKKKVDIAVVEVGLGGRLDATNVLNPLISVMTSISYDHMKELGATLTKITREKAGIIKYGGVVVTAPQEKEARDVIQKVAEDKKTIVVATSVADQERLKPLLRTLHLLGQFQIENASVAIRAAESLLNFGFDKISEASIRRGLKTVRWPGRFEIIRRNPAIILDGAHNGESMEAILAGVEKMFPKSRIVPVLGVSRGKDLKRIREALAKVTDQWIATESGDVRALPARELGGTFVAAPVSKAIQLARSIAKPEDVILVAGSLYLIGEIIRNGQN